VSTTTADVEQDAVEPEVIEPAKWFRRRPYRWLIEWGLIILCALSAALLMRAYVFETFYIPSGSMLPTLQVGDRIIVSKLSVEFGTIHRGDILVFRRPPLEATACGGEQVNDLVKRVIGLPGDRLYSIDNVIYVNGHALAEKWTHTEPLGQAIATSQNPVVVPAHSYFMMGDNHSSSCDSRYWGTLQRSYVVGKVILRIWPLGRFGFL